MGSGELGTGTTTGRSTGAATPALRTASGPDGALVCSLTGDLDLDGLPGVEGPLRGLLADAAPPGVFCLDLSAVGFCDSTGLNLLLRLRLDAEESGVSLVLAQPGPQLSRLFELTGTGAVFRVFGTVGEACAAG
ncbi:STAS domain-containing protein [Kitasatospora sp. KL5]|uniref:STAS domain-containing protein n=1 Tax=Kitasatospora sp. KL5 TaxID=3425125 RepID=UPI003D6FCD01